MRKGHVGADGRRGLTAALAALLCALPLLAGVRVRQSGDAEKSPACAHGPCFEVRRVASCKGDGCLEAVEAEGCDVSPCFTLKQAAKCEGDRCFQVFRVSNSPIARPRVAPHTPTANTKHPPQPKTTAARIVEHVESCKAAGTCIEIKQVKDCKVPPCFDAVKKDNCEGRGCFTVKSF